MAGYYSGKDGQLFIAGEANPAAKVQNWSFSQSMGTLDTTGLGDTDRTLEPGLRSYSGSCRLFYYTSAAGGTSNLNGILTAAVKTDSTVSTAVTLKLRLTEGAPGVLSNTNARDIEFSAFITSVSMSSSVGEVFSADISWEATGAPTAASVLAS